MPEPGDLYKLLKSWEEVGTIPNGMAVVYAGNTNSLPYQTAQRLLSIAGTYDNAVRVGSTYPTAQQYLLSYGSTSQNTGGEYYDPGGQLSRLSGDTAPSQTSTSTDPNAAWANKISMQLQAAGMTFVANTDTTVTAVDQKGTVITYPVTSDGTIAFGKPITPLSEAEQLDNQYRQLQILKLMGDLQSGGGAGTGRVQFESESRLQNAQAAQIEAELAAIAAGTSRLQPFGQGFYDPLTGRMVDPSEIGLGRYNADTSRMGQATNQQLADFQTGPQFAEQQRQFDARLGLDSAAESRLNASAGANAAIGFGNLGVDRARFESEVLRNPADALYRLAAQRGGTSPTDRITMADILNAFRQQPSNISSAVQTRFAPTTGAAVAPRPIVPVPAPKPVVPVVGQPAPTGFTPTPGFNGPYDINGNPVPAGPPGGYTQYTAPNGGETNVGTVSSLTAPTDEGPDLSVFPGLTQADIDAAGGGIGGERDWQDTLAELQQQPGNAFSLARGGLVNDSRFIVGDQRSGKPTGHEEMVINPTNAPLAVVPNQALQGMSRFAGPRYDEGTLKAKPTGGFLNSLRETLESILPKQGYEVPGALSGERPGPEAIDALAKAGQDFLPAVGAPVFKGPQMSRFSMKNIPADWTPDDFRKFSQNIKMDNLNVTKKMYDNAVERASRLNKLAEAAEGDRGMRLSRLADTAFKRADELYQYEKELQEQILHNARQKSYQEVDFIEEGAPGQGLRQALGQEDVPGYAEGTGLFEGYNSSSLFPTQQFTQSGIIDMARQATSPGGASVLGGNMPSRFRIPGLQTPTPMQFNSLSSAEKENLRPRLAAEFDSTLEDLMFDIEQRYSTGPSRMAKFRG